MYRGCKHYYDSDIDHDDDDDDEPEPPPGDPEEHGSYPSGATFDACAARATPSTGIRIDIATLLPPTKVVIAPAAIATARRESFPASAGASPANPALAASHSELQRALDVHLEQREADLACVRAFMAAHDKADRDTTSLDVHVAVAAVTETTIVSHREPPEVAREMHSRSESEEDENVVAATVVTTDVVAPHMIAPLQSFSPDKLAKHPNAYFAPANGIASADQWHKRVHRGPDVLQLIFNTDAVRGVKVLGPRESNRACDSCARGKAHDRPYPPSRNHVTKPGEIVVMDVSGPFPVTGVDGERYIVQAMDKYTKYTYAEAVATKGETTDAVLKFVKQADRRHRVQAVMWDGGKEFVNAVIEQAMADLGIKVLRNAPYTPQENSMAERNGKTIVQDIRVHLIESGLEPQYWPYLLRHTVVLLNMLPRKRLIIGKRAVSPIEAWTGRVPNLSGVRQVGCLVYWFDHNSRDRLVEIDDDGLEMKIGKWNATGQQGTHLGFADESGANYNIIKHSDGQVATVTSLRFIENVKPCLRITEHELVARGLPDDEAVSDILLSIPDPLPPPSSRAVPSAPPLQDLIEDLVDAQSDDETDIKHVSPPVNQQPNPAPPQGGPVPPQGGQDVVQKPQKPREKLSRVIDEKAFHYDPLSKSDGGMPKNDPAYMPQGRAKPVARPLPAVPGQPARPAPRPPPLPAPPVTFATSSHTTTRTAPSATSAEGETEASTVHPAQPVKGKGGSSEATKSNDERKAVGDECETSTVAYPCSEDFNEASCTGTWSATGCIGIKRVAKPLE